MKFLTKHDIAMAQEDQLGSREYYLNFLWKFEPCTVNVIITDIEVEADVDVEMIDVPKQRYTSDMEKMSKWLRPSKKGSL